MNEHRQTREEVVSQAVADYRRDSDRLLHSMLSFANERLSELGMTSIDQAELDSCLIHDGRQVAAVHPREQAATRSKT